MSCGCSSSSPCSQDPCGCPIQLGTECIFYKSTTLDCLSATSGTSLEVILQNINDIICTLNPSGQLISVVESNDSSHITVTSSTTGNVTTYYVDLSSGFLTTISNINTSITNINTILNDLPITLDTDTPADIEILHPNPNEWRVNYIGSSTPATLSGVICANHTQITRPVGGALAITKSFLADYIADYSLAAGDVIKIRSTFQLPTNKDFNAATLCQIYFSNGFELSASNDGQGTEAYSFIFDIDVNVISNSYEADNAVITGNVYRNVGITDGVYSPNNFFSPVFTHIAHCFSKYETIDWTTFQIDNKCTGSTATVEARNDSFRVELLKKI